MSIRLVRFRDPLNYITTLFKWLILSAAVGAIGGCIGSLFHIAIDYATELRVEKSWIIYLLPVGGFVIAFLYRLFKSKGSLDTNRVLVATTGKENVPFVMAPLIFISTIITHLLGGSAGREGAALQLGGSIGYNMGRVFRLDKGSMRIITMTGMSAVFAALFGTPVTAAVFAIEVCLVGTMRYEALVPSITSAFTASYIAKLFKLHPVHFDMNYEFTITAVSVGQILLLSIVCSLVAITFCHGIHNTENLFRKILKSPYARAVTGGVLIAAMSFFIGTQYNGAGMDSIERAIMTGKINPEAFFLKIVFTVITIAAGFKGGEIVPSFFIGSAFGCMFASLIGLNPSFGAAIGFVTVFCSVVNCPMASIILSIEVFGVNNLIIFALCCAISYMMSGHASLYSVQEFRYSKLGVRNIHEKTK